MLKSWKLRAAVAGVAIAAAPLALMGSAVALPAAPTITSLTPTNGPAGTSVTVRGACGAAAVPATSVVLYLTGPAITTPAPGQAFGATLVPGSGSGDFTGTVVIPTGARSPEIYDVKARCTDSTGTGPLSINGGTFTVNDAPLLPPVTIPPIAGITSTSGNTTPTIPPATTVGATTGVATPIVAVPTFAG